MMLIDIDSCRENDHGQTLSGGEPQVLRARFGPLPREARAFFGELRNQETRGSQRKPSQFHPIQFSVLFESQELDGGLLVWEAFPLEDSWRLWSRSDFNPHPWLRFLLAESGAAQGKARLPQHLPRQPEQYIKTMLDVEVLGPSRPEHQHVFPGFPPKDPEHVYPCGLLVPFPVPWRCCGPSSHSKAL